MVYTVREFRKKVKEALDKASGGEVVEIERSGIVYTLELKKEECVHKELKNLIPEYGCGCKKETGAMLCKKHGRY